MRDVEVSKGILRAALVVSLLAHAAMLFAATIPSIQATLAASSEALLEPPPAPGEWTGTTAEVPGGERLYDVSLSGSPAMPPAPAADVPVVPAPAAPTDVASSLPAPPRTSESKPAPRSAGMRATEQERPRQPAQAKARPPTSPSNPDEKSPPDPYEEAEAEKEAHAGREEPSDRQERPPSATASPTLATRRPSSSPAASSDPSSALTAAAGAGASEEGGGGSFGSVGRAAVRDLGRAFTQAIPPACDSDPLWGKVSPGSAGSITIAIEVEESGRISSLKSLDEDPPKALVSLARRTVAMLKAGTFSLRSGAVSGGRQTLRISAIATDGAPPEGKTIALAHMFSGGVGTAAFTQSSGRHVEVTVRVVRVEVVGPAPR